MKLQGLIDDHSLHHAIKTLRHITKSAFPFNIKETVNDLAFEGRKAAIDEQRNQFVIRNKWTESQTIVNKARSNKDISKIQAELGHTQEYMAIQETGGVVRAKKRWKYIPTRKARISSRYTRKVRKAFQMRAVQVSPTSEFFVGKIKGKRGLYRKVGKKKKIVMVYDMRFTKVEVRKKPWLERAKDKITPAMAKKFFLIHAKKSMKKLKKRK